MDKGLPVFRCPGGISNGDLHGETMKTILSILLWIWQAPQNVVGLALRLWYRGRIAVVLLYDHHCGGVTYRVVPDLPGGGISLGATVLVRYYFIESPELYAHEYGHVKQSRILGPLYLFVIGIPSLLWACWYRKHKRGSYYAFYTEKWADKLGGVVRTEK